MQLRNRPEKPTLLKCFSLSVLFWEKKLRGHHHLLVQNKESTDLPKGSSSPLLSLIDHVRRAARPDRAPPSNSSRSHSSCKHQQRCCSPGQPVSPRAPHGRTQLRTADSHCACSSASRGTPLLQSSENENKRCSFPSLYSRS